MKPITPFRWTFRPDPDPATVEQLGAAINVNPVLAKILVQRQVDTYDFAKSYFRPSLNELPDPFLMKNMESAVNRLQKAILAGEKILIYGDYDVDGTTSVALVFGFLRKIYPHLPLFFYIPNRYTEGYGISFQGMDWASENGISLIISLDCGIKAFETIRYARSKNIDFIVCDHHLPSLELPPATILDAKQPDCPYPYKHLSGCGVGFKFMQAFCIAQDLPFDELYRNLDLLALSIAADIVPITGENRILTYHGLLQLNDNHRFGTEALAELAGLRKPIDISSIVFGLAPRINVFGRLNHAKTAVELLLSQNLETARELSRLANQYNEERQGFDSQTTEEAVEMIEKNGWQKNYSTILYKPTWNKGIVGIVASRCIEYYYRPTIILTQAEDGKIVGSARSVSNFDMYEALTVCSPLLEQYGGHHHAAGLALKAEKLPEFREKFEKIAQAWLQPEDMIPEIEIDAEIPQLSMLTFQFLKILHQMSPFGPENMNPVFVSRGVTAANIKVLKEKHLRFYVKQGNMTLEAIAFQMAAYYDMISYGKPFDVCYTIAESNFLGVKSIQMTVRDIKPHKK